MSIEAYELIDGNRVEVPGSAPPSNGQAPDEVSANGTGTPGATDSPPAGEGQPSASPTETQPPVSGEGTGDTDDDEPLRDDSEITAARLERRFARLTRLRRQAERELERDRHQHNIELARTRGELEAVQRMLQGAAPELPQTPVQPAGPPQAEQFASHEDFVLAAARYGAQQEFQARDQQTQEQRQREQQHRFQQDLVTREQQFKESHPDFDQVVRGGLAGKVSLVLQQALMLVPDGPAVAYTLAQQPDLVQRLNGLPPPLVLVELGRLSPPPEPRNVTPNGIGPMTNGTPPAQALHAPETPLSGGGAGAPTGGYREDFTQQEYRAWRARTSQLPDWKER